MILYNASVLSKVYHLILALSLLYLRFCKIIAIFLPFLKSMNTSISETAWIVFISLDEMIQNVITPEYTLDH